MKKNLIKAVVIVMAVIVVFSVGEMASAKTKPETTYKNPKSQNNEVSVQSKAVVYNNGTARVEYKGVLYFIDYKEGICSFDLKTNKKMDLKTESYMSGNRLWIVGERIFYLNRGNLNSMKLDGSKKKVVRQGVNGEKSGISAVAVKGDFLYLSSWEDSDNTLSIEKITSSGKKVEGVKLECGEQPLVIIDDVVIFGDALLYKDTNGKYAIDLYVGEMGKELKLVSGKVAGNFNCENLKYVDVVKKYGDYLYGYCYIEPGTFQSLSGSVFSFSIKTGKIVMDGKQLFLNSSCFYKNSLYVGKGLNDKKTVKYQINKKTGKWKKTIYSSCLGTVAGDKIYYERNEKGRKAIVSFSMKSRKETVIHDAYKAKADFYYGAATSPDSYIDVINGRLYMRVADCSSNEYDYWRLLADRYMYYMIELKSNKCTLISTVEYK